MIPAAFLALDPGFSKSNGTGWALFVGGQLLAAGLSDSTETDFRARIGEIVAGVPKTAPHRVIEHMRIYPGPQQKGDQNDLLNLAFLEGALSRDAESYELVEARSWKGQVDKEIMQARIAKRFPILTPEGIVFDRALSKIRAREKVGSVVEACGIGLFRAGRLG